MALQCFTKSSWFFSEKRYCHRARESFRHCDYEGKNIVLLFQLCLLQTHRERDITYFGAFKTRSGARTIAEYQKWTFWSQIVLMVVNSILSIWGKKSVLGPLNPRRIRDPLRVSNYVPGLHDVERRRCWLTYFRKSKFLTYYDRGRS